MGLAPTQDCVTVGGLPPPYNASNAACCQTAVGAAAQWGWPFELRLCEGGGKGDARGPHPLPAPMRLSPSTSFRFSPAADNATYVIARAAVAGTSVALTPFNASQPGPFTGVRYAWQGFPLCVLSNAQGMPTAPFAVNL